MSLHRMDCPYCGANIEANTDGRKIVYCTYCGKQIRVENDSKNITINQNININQNISQRVTNDAEILKEQNRHRESSWKFIFIGVAFVLLVSGIIYIGSNRKKNTVSTVTATNDNEKTTSTHTEDSYTQLSNNSNTQADSHIDESQNQSDATVIVDDILYINEETTFPVVLYEGDFGTYCLNSVIHYDQANSPINGVGFGFEMEFENGTDGFAYCCLGKGYLNDYRVPIYTKKAEIAAIASGKKGVITSIVFDEDITDKMKDFKQVECTFFIENEKEEKLLSRKIVISESVIEYKENNVQPETQVREPLELVESEYCVRASSHYKYIYYTVKIYNPNKEYAIEYPTIMITARDADGTVLATYDEILDSIAAGDTIIFGSEVNYEGKEPSSVEISLEDLSKWKYVLQDGSNTIRQDELAISNISERRGSFNNTITGEVTNNSDIDLSGPKIIVILKNNGELAWASFTYVNRLNSGKTLPFQIGIDSDIKYDSFEIYGICD